MTLGSRLAWSLGLLTCAACVEVRLERTPTEPEPPPAPTAPVDPTEPPASPASFCQGTLFTGNDDEAVAVLQQEDLFLRLLRDGSAVPLAVDTPAPPSEDIYPWRSVQAGGDVIVVTVGWLVPGPAFDGHYATRWFNRRGELIDELDSTEQQTVVAVSEDGTTILFSYDYETSEALHWARLPSGDMVELEAFEPIGLPLAGGWLLGRDEGGEFQFLELATGERRVVADLDADQYPSYDEFGFHFVSFTGAVATLVSESPNERREVPLWDLGDDQAYVESVARGRYVLLTVYDQLGNEARYRIDLETQAITSADLPPPDPILDLAHQCSFSSRSLASDGAVLAMWRSGGDAQLARLDPESEAWSLVAEPIGNPGAFDYREAAGSYVVVANDGNQAFCLPIEWQEPPSPRALPIEALQIVRPSTGSRTIIEMSDGYWVDSWAVQMVHDGTCAFLPAIDGGGQILDVISSELTPVDATSVVWMR